MIPIRRCLPVAILLALTACKKPQPKIIVPDVFRVKFET